jgi:FMN phosphatase YigB (HAD superfamily)
MSMPQPEASEIKALTFDVFGTVVDWHGSVAREVRALAAKKGVRVNAVNSPKRGAQVTDPRWTACAAESCRG